MIFLLFIINFATFANAVVQVEAFDRFRAEYFSKLDYFKPEIKETIIAYEAQLLREAAPLLTRAERREILLNEEQALKLVYTGMFIRNTNEALQFGAINLSELALSHPLNESTDLNQELAAREYYRVRLFNQALLVLKNDPLVIGFKTGAEVWALSYESDSKHLVKKVDEFLNFSKEKPFPNVFSALIVGHFVPLTPTQQNKLDKLARSTVMRLGLGLFSRPKRPLDKHPLSFDTKRFAPFGRQGAHLLLADSLINTARRYDEQGKNFLKGIHLEMGLGTFKNFYKKTMRVSTNRWPNLLNLEDRINMAKAYKENRGDYTPSDFKTRKMYSCASCHSHE